ncbi:hypothetical protein [Streptomyces viridosporus]|uniref:hypothetical protein n=1 Tax=Streptomyces viridosporus TaxID=67581 RepID=UPI0036FD852B
MYALRSSVAPKGDRQQSRTAMFQPAAVLLRSSAAPEGDRQLSMAAATSAQKSLRSSAAPEGDRQITRAADLLEVGALRSSAAPEGDRQRGRWLDRVPRPAVAILGHSGGRPPDVGDALDGFRQHVAILGHLGGRPPAGIDGIRAAGNIQLQSSVTPEGDRHSRRTR